jgi:site-specific DNA-methyltransferase (adenine-specific)
MSNIELFQEDNMHVMSRYPDKYFDLAIVDPPYGIGEDGKSNHSRSKLGKAKEYTPKNWDNAAPPKAYFDELRRVSKHQIIWGANHFISKVPLDSSCWIVWDKDNGLNDFADCELALTSFPTAVRKFKYTWHGMRQEDMKNKEQRIHPTQKPSQLYKWLLKNYATPDMKLLDTHLGSMSSVIAAYDFGIAEFVGCEIDAEYFEKGKARFEQHKRQLNLFAA